MENMEKTDKIKVYIEWYMIRCQEQYNDYHKGIFDTCVDILNFIDTIDTKVFPIAMIKNWTEKRKTIWKDKYE